MIGCGDIPGKKSLFACEHHFLVAVKLDVGFDTHMAVFGIVVIVLSWYLDTVCYIYVPGVNK